MSVIAVDGFHLKINQAQVGKMLARVITGYFEVIHCETYNQGTGKTWYVKISNKLDPQEIIEKINNMVLGKKKNVLHAYVPDNVSGSTGKRKVTGPNSSEKMLSKTNYRQEKVISIAHAEIMTELQYKYTGLYELSKDGSHTLLEAIGMTIHERLQRLVSSEPAADAFVLTGRYRKAHPHFGDFQLVLGTLHRLQDAAGAPRAQLQESELARPAKDVAVVDDVPYAKAQEFVNKYIDRIIKRLEEHVAAYELEAKPEDGEEATARKTVRRHLTHLMPLLPSMMRQVVLNHVTQGNKKNRYLRMRMYGEPYLAGKEHTLPLLRRVCAQRGFRWKSMYNLLVFQAPIEQYARVMALDGTSLGGSKLVIRSSHAQIYRDSLSKNAPGTDPADMDDEETMLEV